jgi:phytoene dehydrogenase-like protein
MSSTMKRNGAETEAGRIPEQTGAEDDYQVIVVGAGIGGLSAAALVARRGYKVAVVEAHHLCGGSCTSWTRFVELTGGRRQFVFDSGVQDISGLGVSGPLTNLLNQTGASGKINWKRVHHLYWRKGVRVNGGLTSAEFVGNLCRVFPDDADGINRFFSEMEAVYRELYLDVEKSGGIPVPPSKSELHLWPERHPHAFRWMREPFSKMLDAFISGEAARGLLETLSEYITDDPRRLSVQDMAPLFGYYFEGGWYPAGGSQRLPNLLAAIVRRNGGRLLLRTRVGRIVVKNGKVCGVETSDGRRLSAPVVIANGDIVSALSELVEPSELPARYAERVARLNRGPTAILMSLGLSTVMPLPPRIFIQTDEIAFGVGNPSVFDPSLAPEGHSAVTVLLLLPESTSAEWLDKNDPTYRLRKEQISERILDAIEQSVFPELRQHIVYREVATPATFVTFTGAKNGNIYGSARGAWRPGMQSPIPGLLLVGAGTDCGAGVEAVVISGTRAANLVCDTAELSPREVP